jgi:hypothetical protein
MRKIYVIVNSYTDYCGTAIATDGGAFFNLDVAKVELRNYIKDIWGEILDEGTIENGFETDMLWSYEDGDYNVSMIEIHEVEIKH